MISQVNKRLRIGALNGYNIEKVQSRNHIHHLTMRGRWSWEDH